MLITRNHSLGAYYTKNFQIQCSTLSNVANESHPDIPPIRNSYKTAVQTLMAGPTPPQNIVQLHLISLKECENL
jgi:hypothetical protein